MVQRNLLACWFPIALYLILSKNLIYGIPNMHSYSILGHNRQFSMRLFGGSSKMTAAKEAEVHFKVHSDHFDPFDKSISQGSKTFDSSHSHGLRRKKVEAIDDCMRTPKSAGSKSNKNEFFSPLFQTPMKQHSVEFAGYIKICSDHNIWVSQIQSIRLYLILRNFAGLHRALGNARWRLKFHQAR